MKCFGRTSASSGAEGCCRRDLFAEYLVITGKKKRDIFSQCKSISLLEFLSLGNYSKQLNIVWLPVVADGYFLYHSECQKMPLRKIYLVKKEGLFSIHRNMGPAFYFFLSFLGETFLSECSLN